MDFRTWLINEAREKMIVYHGTTDALLRPILSQGLIANPTRRTWDKDDNTSFSSSSRASLKGVYVTTNLLTALSSARISRERRGQLETNSNLIVVLAVEPKTLVGDEDGVVYALRRLPSPYPGMASASEHESTAARLYSTFLKLKYNEYEGEDAEYRRQQDEQEFEAWRNAYAERIADQLLFDSEFEVHSNLKTRLQYILRNIFIISLARAASYVDPGRWYWDEWKNHQNKWPNSQKAERDFLKAAEQITLTLKRKFQVESGVNFTARLTDNVGYTGANRIISLIRVHDVRSEGVYRTIEPVYGELPDDFIQKYKQLIGQPVMHDEWMKMQHV